MTALRDVSVEIPAGDQVAVVGPSGSGKTTMLTILGTLERPTTGDVRVAGHDTATASDGELAGLRAHQIGFVFQAFHLQESMTAVDNVANGMLYTGMPLGGDAQLAREALERVGLGHRLDFKPKQLSGGERQRVAIARAIAKRPAIILADEPTGNLDSKSGAGVLDVLHELGSDGATLVLITHDEQHRRRLSPAPAHARRRDRRGRARMTDVVSEGTAAATRAAGAIGRARLPPRELLGVALQGLRTRKLRAALSALGIAIGIGAMVAVVGVSSSAQANLIAEIDALGTNLLTVSPGTDFLGNSAVLAPSSVPMIQHMLHVESDAPIYQLTNANVYRTPYVPAEQTGGIGVDAASDNLPQVVGTTLASGHFLNAVSRALPGGRARRAGRGDAADHARRRPRDALHRQPLVRRRRDPQAGQARLVAGLGRVHLAAGRRAAVPAAARTQRDLRAQRPRTPSPRSRTCCPPPPTRRTRAASASTARQTCSRRVPPPRASSRHCCSAWAPSRCWSARSGSRTSW